MCSAVVTNTSGPSTSTSSSSTTSASSSGIIVGTRAINRDVKLLLKQKLFEIDFPSEDNIFEIDLVIKCGGDWEGIVHKFRAKVPTNYPFSYPIITCLESEKAFHPNIQTSDGSICLGILTSEEWKAMYTLTDICNAISSMFFVPNWDHSLNQEAFELFHDNKEEYYRRLRALGATLSSTDTCEKKGLDTSSGKEEEHVDGIANSAVEESSSVRKACVPKKKPSKKGSGSSKSAPLSQCIEGVTGIQIDECEGAPSRSNGSYNHHECKSVGKLRAGSDSVQGLGLGNGSYLSGMPGTKVPSDPSSLASEYSDLSSSDQNIELSPISETTSMVGLGSYVCCVTHFFSSFLRFCEFFESCHCDKSTLL